MSEDKNVTLVRVQVPVRSREGRDSRVYTAGEEELDKNLPHYNDKGIAVWATSLLLVGELAGGGIVALPQAVQFMGWLPGLIGLLVFACICTYMGILLGRCWNMLQARWPEYREHCKRPYQEIGRRAVGDWMTYLISVTIDFTLFGTCVSYLILAATNIQIELVDWFDLHSLKFCQLMLILAVVVTPLMFLGSPKNFWHVVVVAMVCTTIAVVVMIIGMILDYNRDHSEHVTTMMPNMTTTEITTTPQSDQDIVNEFFLAFGVVLYAYTGHSVFPTIQQDMKHPKQWHWAVVISYLVQLAFYLPISFLGYVVYGADLQSDVIQNLETSWCQSIVSVLISFHVLFSFILMSNPVSQELEHIFGVPHRFGWKRVVVRSALVAAILFVAESIPNFGPLLSLIGGLSSVVLALIFPPIFYYRLRKQVPETAEKVVYYVPDDKLKSEPSAGEATRPVPWYIAVLLLCIIVIGILGAVGSTYSSLKTLIDPTDEDKFKAPCYVS